MQYLGLSVDTPWYYNEKTRNMGQKKYEAILMKYISCVTDEKLEIKYWAANDDCDFLREQLKELQADLLDMSDKELVECRSLLLERINWCMTAILES